MQIDINVKTYSIKQRILAFFMAFMIFTMTCPEIFEGWGIGLIVHATATGQIHYTNADNTSLYKDAMNTNRTGNTSVPNTMLAQGSGQPHTGNTFTYTGKYNNNNKTTLFDYVSDYELAGTYNTCYQNESGYVDVYTALNNSIAQSYSSTDNKYSQSSENITIRLNPNSTDYTGTVVYIYFYNTTTTPVYSYDWPGIPMVYDDGDFVFTAKYTDMGSPSNFIINGGNGNWQTDDFACPSAGQAFTFNQTTNNIALKLKSLPSGTSTVNVHLWTDGHSTSWPGNGMSISGDTATYTLSNWTPDHLIFNGVNGGGDSWKTSDIELTMVPGHTYRYNSPPSLSGDSVGVGKGGTDFHFDTFNVTKDSTVGTAEPIYNSKYSIPLYFGDFWKNDNSSGYSVSNRPYYNNFFWQANLGMKTRNDATNTSSPDHFNQRGHAVVQDLVYDKLSGSTLNAANATGDILDKSGVSTAGNTISGNALPLFSTAWINDANHTERTSLIKYYDTDTVDGKDYNITFPFYETYSEFNNSSGSNTINSGTVKLKTYDTKWNDASHNEVARFYQFDSKEANLIFNITSDDDHKGYFSETTGATGSDIYFGSSVDSDRGNVGFFPFNSSNWYNSNNSRENNHNLGFGTKMSMDFQLESDGCVSAVKLNDSTGKLESLDTATRIHTIFEFTGDDDLWVFIDGNLVLDMGGPHYAAHGIIDFAGMSATADPALKFGTNSSGTETTAYDALDAAITTKTLSGSDFIAKLAGDNTTDGSGNPTYDTSVTHTMTIFYMERGMLDSNLLIRYNYSPISNTSRMKIAEVTKFVDENGVALVNPGLIDLTKAAAEDDVFKYTVSNMIPNGVTTEAPLETGAKYPVTAQHIRTAEDTTTKTVLTHNLQNTTPAEMKFTPGAVDTETYVKNTSYWWVDGFSDTDYLVGKTTNSGNDYPGGDLWLMYGTNDSVYDSTNTGKESSAEFEKQFTKNSNMKIVQGANIYRLNRSTAARLFNSDGTLNATETSTRAVADYYSTNYRLVDRAFNQIFSEPSATYLATTGQNARNATFEFKNDDSVSEHLAVMLTEYVENTVNTRNLAITKNVSGSTSTSTFTLKVTFEDVFGVDSVDLDNNGYGNITITGSNNDNGKLNADGTFSITAGHTAIISGIPYGTKYTVVEPTHPAGATVSGEVKKPTALTSNDGTVTVTVENAYASETSVDVHKTNSDGSTELAGAEFELWYKETLTPPTYIFNEPELVPNQLNTMKVTATPSQLGVPGPEIPESITTYTFTTTYNPPQLPNVTDKDWILPRNDTDYIYFRDYNTGTTGWEDSASFNDTDKDAANTNGNDGKRSWRGTEFDTHQEHHQDLELFFDDNDTYWMAAEFSGGGKKTIRYAMWERFVDEYDNSTPDDADDDVITTIWKIQPPDGYTQVKFMMLSGDTVIRETQSIPYELGKIYHKTSWGKWTKRNGLDSYYDVPIDSEGYWAPNSTASGAITDKRMTGEIPGTNHEQYTGKMLQARKYEPTAQKVIFHCNSSNVWHNIHIEFFEDEDGNHPVNDQAFPGYMMEPYAYAGDDYRMSDGYLTYELTIPATAKYFRINNGKEGGAYSYKTAITALKDGSTTANGKGKKNYGNYWQIDTEDYANNSVTLKQWTPQKEENGITDAIPNKDYKNAEVTSDYDYIYFDNSTADWSKVYAYFYAGGNLRADNWQRACYSSWPGVAPAGTEYGDVHSNTYSIKVKEDEEVDGDEYNGTNTSGTLNPETVINSNIYKFRIPKGDRKNYSKVIFNNGLSSQSGGAETGVIEYQPGHIYTVKGKATKHYENSPTVLYEASTVENTTEYIYVKNTARWDDLHITFYDANGGQILQQGKGYVMDYADTGANTGYFKIPLPKDAAKFSVNNGIGNSSVSPLVDIVRLNDDGTVKTNAESGDEFAYELTNTSDDIKLTRSTITTKKQVDKTQPTPQEEGFEGYTKINNPATSSNNKADPKQIPQVRQTTKNGITTDDTLNIRDMANWNVDIGKLYVTFYRENGTAVGPNVAIKTVADSQNKKWYTKKIPNFSSNPVNAFTVTYIKNDNTYTTPKYPIYPNTNTGTLDGVERTESGCMFFDTQGSGVKSTLVMTNVEPATNVNTVDDETYPKRGDFLYLTGTSATAPTVTFYASGTNVIKSGVQAKYINKEGTSPNIKYWYKVSIPDGAQSFSIGEGTTTYPIYELKSKVSWYEKDYTLGDMQYRFNGTTATCVYPVFTPTPVNELKISDGHTLTSKVAVLVDEDAISAYRNATATKLPTTTGGSSPSTQILYNTATDNVTYSWTEGTTVADTNKIYFDNSNSWTTPKVHLFGGTSSSDTSWPGSTMTQVGTSDIYYLDLSGTDYTKCIFSNNGANQTETLTIPNISTQSKICAPQGTPVVDTENIYVQQPTGGSWNDTYATFYNSNDQEVETVHSTGNATYTTVTHNGVTGGYTISNVHKVKVPTTGSPVKVMFHNNSSPSSNNYSSVKSPYTIGHLYTVNSGTVGNENASNLGVWDGGGVEVTTWDWSDYGTSSSSVSYTYSYQPEDRYGMISDQNSTTPVTAGYADVNDFIYIVTSLSDPYINFLDSSNNQIGTYSTASAKGVPLKYTGYTGAGTIANPYKIRLPKNAAKFTISNDSTTGTAQLITESSLKAKIGTEQQEITLPNDYYHAGTTFYINSSCEVDADKNNDGFTDGKKLRTGFTPYKTETMTDPLQPMSDADFVFFTDTDGTFANSNKVYAYFYGDVDGEYKAWPGTMATSATSTSAATTYTNNNGKTVYKFRIPKDDDGVYSWVIFTDGAASPKITAAQEISGGKNYILGTDNGETYGTMTANVYGVSAKNKTTSPSTVNYNTSDNRTIYIINNGTTCHAEDETDKPGGRYILDDMHVEFFTDANGSTPVGTPEGYIPEKAGTHVNDTVYRITVPSNAKFFRINNGNGKDNVTDNHNHTRNSEIKQITDNGLYQFVTETKYTKDGSDPTTVAQLSSPEYLLTLTNKIELDDDTQVTSETYDVHLATIKTGSDGKTSEILWLRDMPTGVDTAYLANTASDIGVANKKVKVKKQGTYYWKEVTPPSGYKLSTNNKVEFTLPVNNYQPAEFTNPPIETGSLAITKKLHSVDATNGNTAETGKLFTFTIELNAPVGSKWSDFVTNPIVSFTGDHAPEALIVANSEVITGTNRKFSVKLPADGSTTATLTNIPYGTTYNITETAPTTDYSSTPVEIKYLNDNTIVDEMKGTVKAESTSYLVTDKHEVGSLTLKDIVIDRGVDALRYANVNQPKNVGQSNEYVDYTKYDYYVILEAPEGIDLKDYISMDDLKGIISFKTGDINCPTGNLITYYPLSGEPVTYAVPSSTSTGSRWKTTSTSTIGETSDRSRYLFHIDVTSSVDGAKTISNIPIGTQYSVVEVKPTATFNGEDSSATATDYTGEGVSWFGTEGVPAANPGKITLNYVDEKSNISPTVTITNYYRYSKKEVILTKTAKEKVGTTDIGDTLAGAKFKLVDVNESDPTKVIKFKMTQVDPDTTDTDSRTTNIYTVDNSGSYNVSSTNSWLETGEDGKLHIKDLPYGDYYLEEQAAPNGYSHIDSNTGTNKKVYFSVGENREVKEITAADEMAPAYIKLFEHIDMKKKAWGDPTFVFKIKQTGYYKNDGTNDIQTIDNGKEILVALTVDDNNNIKQVYKWFGADGTTPTLFGNDFNDPIKTDYNSWLVEGTTDLNDYQGLFNIDSKGRIRVEPGKYEITRLPVSRYEFVTNGKTAVYDNDDEPPAWTEYKEVNNAKSEKLTIDALPAGNTIDVHYYDKVGYYDKFSQVDEVINSLHQYTVSNSTKESIKGIRVEDYKVDTVSNKDADIVGGNGTLTTLSLQQSPRFKAYYIYADGTESQITNQTELAKFVISYEYDSTSGDDDHFGHQTTAADNDFQYNTETDVITVANYADRYKNGVYTLKATYDGKFSANFDIVFERS